MGVMKSWLLVCIIILSQTVNAQYKVKIEITSLPASLKTDVVYMAGNFNGWNPQDEKNKITKNEKGQFYVQLPSIDAGSYEFKFTRGDWNTVETDLQGKDIPNRTIHIQSDTNISFSIAAWKDAFAAAEKRKSTASSQVKVMDSAFNIPQLNRKRKIWIYFPKDYILSGKKYPVLYMHDGQNLFDEASSFAGEWGVDEYLDSIKASCIVVGIDNGGVKRMNEYNPNETKQFGKGEGKEYLEFIVKNLKPYIDKRYRTLDDKANTHIAGSSMGGLISLYAGIYYPDVFGTMGVFSPSFWLVSDLPEQINLIPKKSSFKKQRYYFYGGGKEGDNLKTLINTVSAKLKERLGASTTVIINEEGRHNEATWKYQFPSFYEWMIF
jgi:predicted alpha/beta superfamily hydrolase